MARYRKKIPLYEAIIKTRPKSRRGKALHPEKSDKGESATAEPAFQVPEAPVRWPRKPKTMQFNAGRIEISMPYQLAIVLLLGVVLLILVVFRLGQITYLSSQEAVGSGAKMSKAARQTPTGRTQIPKVIEKTAPELSAAEKAKPVKLKGNNRIVIQTYHLRDHLEPVKQYFAGFGIETELRKIDNRWFLVTKDKYENPERRGTDGYLAKQRIIELGAKYKAPEGYGTFGPKPFHDAYGMRFND